MKLLLVVLLFTLSSAVLASNSLVRIDCQEDTNGAAVYLDDAYQFECEDYAKLPILTTAGEHELRVVRPVGREFEQVFVRSIELRAGVPERIRVSLPEKTLTAYGKEQEALRKEEARIAAERAEKARQKRARIAAEKAAQAELDKDLASARSGNADAMSRMAQRYRSGDGVPVNTQTASEWEAKAERQQKIDDIEASKMEYFAMSESALLGIYGDNPGSSEITLAPWIVAPTFTAELLSSPITTTDQQIKDSELETLRRQTAAARWANPDSLVARAADKL